MRNPITAAAKRLRTAGRRAVRALAYRRYATARAYYRRELRRTKGRAAKQLLVYTMGKVGSTALTASLKAARPEMGVFHIHALTRRELQFAEKVFRANWRSRSGNPHALWQSEYLLEVGAAPGDGKWNVVTIIRDPVARNLSACFEIMDTQLGFGYRDRAKRVSSEELLAQIDGLFWSEYPDHDVPLEWLDKQVGRVLGIDVYASDFPRERGYEIYEGGSARLLLVKLSKLNACIGTAMESFLGLADFQIQERNVGAEKYYSETYRAFLDAVRIPDSYLDRMYSSRYSRHFYTAAELEAFRARWCAPLGHRAVQ